MASKANFTPDEWSRVLASPMLPFSDVHFEDLDKDLMGPEELPKAEALWSLAQGQTA